MPSRPFMSMRVLSGVFALFVVALCASPVTAQFNQWAFGRTPDETARRISAIPSGGTISCGEVVTTRQDAAANILWMLQIDFFYPHVAIPTSDGGFAVAGAYFLDNEMMTLLVKLTPAGTPQWHHLYPGTHVYEYCDLIQSADGGFVIALEYDPPESSFRVPFLIKTKADGTPEWMNRYVPNGYTSPGGEFSFVQEDVGPTGESIFNLAGTIGEFPLGKSETLLMRVADDGSVMNARSIGFDNHNDNARGLIRESDHSFLVTGYSKEIGEGGGTYLMRVMDDFSIDWYVGIHGFTGTKEIHLGATNQAVLGGSATYPNPVTNAALLSIDLPSKSLLWGMQYGGPDDEDRGESIALNTNGYDIFGTTKSFDIMPNTDFYLVKTDPLGNSGCNEDIYAPQIVPNHPQEIVESFEIRDYDEIPQSNIKWGFVEYFERKLCGDPEPCICVAPPEGMMAWWTFDELVGPTAAESIAGLDGVYIDNPLPLAAKVDNGLLFDGIDDYVQAPDGPTVNVPASQGTPEGAFSIDAWIRIDDQATYGWGPIVEKRSSSGSPGYAFYVHDGVLNLALNDGSATMIFTSAQALPMNDYVHVAIAVNRAMPGEARFFVDGVSDVAIEPMSVMGSLINNAPVWIGAMRYGLAPGDDRRYFNGVIDEVEFFNRALDDSEVQAIYNAQECGKCKLECHVPWDEPFCVGDDKIEITVTVCNNSSADVTVDVSFSQVNPPVCGNIPGPTGFTVLSPAIPVVVPGNSCVDVLVSVEKPIDMVNMFDLGCYQAMFTNLDNGQSTTCIGSVIYRPDLCPGSGDPTGAVVVDLIPEIDTGISIEITNTGLKQEFIQWRAVVYGSGMELSQNIGVNGSAPGEFAGGKVMLPLGESTVLEFNLLARDFEGLTRSDFVLSTLNGNNAVPLMSVALRTVLDDSVCVGDINDDGIVNGADLATLLGAWGSCTGCASDLNGDGKVDGADLAIVLGAWGICP